MSRRPNVVFVLTDDQGYGEIGAHGNAWIRTPNMDKLHDEGVRFTHYHVGTTCAPTRSGLMTGHHCNSAGVWHTIGGRSLLRPDEWTLADALKSAGYRTGHFGKWHLGDCKPFRPHDRGFEETVYHCGGGVGNTADAWGNDYFDDTYQVNGTPQKFEGYCTDVFFREGMKFIEAHKDEPFFCYIATNAPHGPFNVEPEYMNLYTDTAPHENRARFYGMVTNIDENLGKLRAKLDELGLTDNTIVMFMTDNGSGGGNTPDRETSYVEEGPCQFNDGMRGTKGSEYEGGHRVPWFLHWPTGHLTGGRSIERLASYVDFMPTILDLCGVTVPAERNFQGRSLKPLLAGDAPDADWTQRILVTDTQRLARPIKWRRSCVMQDKWRLINGTELYDMEADWGQRNDIAAEHPGKIAELRAGYEAWWTTVSEQFDRDIPCELGADEETVTLTTHDIRNEAANTAWNQGHVRRGHVCSGYWEVNFARAGRYEFAMQRWPRDAGHALGAGIDGDDVEWRKDAIAKNETSKYSGGVALDLRWATIEAFGKTQWAEVDADATQLTFEMDLPAGETHLFAGFCDAYQTIAPYFIYVRYLGAS